MCRWPLSATVPLVLGTKPLLLERVSYFESGVWTFARLALCEA